MGTRKAYVEGMNFISNCRANQYPNIWIYELWMWKIITCKILALSLSNKNIGEEGINNILINKLSQENDRNTVINALKNIEDLHSKTIILM